MENEIKTYIVAINGYYIDEELVYRVSGTRNAVYKELCKRIDEFTEGMCFDSEWDYTDRKVLSIYSDGSMSKTLNFHGKEQYYIAVPEELPVLL